MKITNILRSIVAPVCFVFCLFPARVLLLILCFSGGPILSFAQCKPFIKIDGIRILASGENVDENGIRLPHWLKAGQTLAADQNVYSISVLEFEVNGTSLDFSQVLKVTSVQTVPVGPPEKVWKIESISKLNAVTSAGNSITFSTAGTSNWMVPACVNYICIEAWGGGGGGGGQFVGANGGGGGGGGGYGYECFTVTPGAVYAVTVGAGGNGGVGGSAENGFPGTSSSVGALITATFGAGGIVGNGAGTGGAFGTSTASTNVPGIVGATRSGAVGGTGGQGGNGGLGGTCAAANGNPGTAPAGGGGGARGTGASTNGGAGAAGKVIISW